MRRNLRVSIEENGSVRWPHQLTLSTLGLVSIDCYRDRSQCNTFTVGLSNVFDFPTFQDENYSPSQSPASELVLSLVTIWSSEPDVLAIGEGKSTQFDVRSRFETIHHEDRGSGEQSSSSKGET
ncbi:hypothetical protein T11_18148 [Trichinella zimbabwensis]|uniref:Uncharacterized protein n=1 Tax=Trichinella zimbabwensis TaxID=268475 RepID=A0A0V1GUW7_9BILA|nr:hypothetical protein T11_18148 [Trichinella zimbabwensis]